MSEYGEAMEWRNCRYCNLRRYCSPASMRDHEEDCDKRPSRLARMRLCPTCASVLEKVLPNSWICVNINCDFTVDVLPGGKLQS